MKEKQDTNAVLRELNRIYEDKIWELQAILGYSVFENKEWEKIIKLKEEADV